MVAARRQQRAVLTQSVRRLTYLGLGRALSRWCQMASEAQHQQAVLVQVIRRLALANTGAPPAHLLVELSPSGPATFSRSVPTCVQAAHWTAGLRF